MLNNRILYCIVDNKNRVAAANTIDFLERNLFTVKIIIAGQGNKIIPHYLLNNVQLDMDPATEQPEATADSDRRFYFMTDNPDFLKLVYRLYHDIFSEFIFFHGDHNVENYLMLDDVYERLIKEPFRREEKLYKPVYSNNTTTPLVDIPMIDIESLIIPSVTDMNENRATSLYFFDGEHFIFNPVGVGLQVIPFSAESHNNTILPENLFIYMNYNQEMLERMTSHIHSIDLHKEYFASNKKKVMDDFVDWADAIRCAGYFERHLYNKFMDILANNCNVRGKLFLLSYRLKMASNSSEISSLIESILRVSLNSYLDANELYYVYYQVTSVLFTYPSLHNEDISRLTAALRKRVYDYYATLCGDMNYIEKAERHEQFVVVVTSQMLSLSHGPTKTALDRCYALIKDLNKEIKLICTKEMLAPSGEIPYFMPGTPNVIPEYDNWNALEYNGVSIPFQQISGKMPRQEGIKEIMNYISLTKPYFVVSIGSGLIPEIIDMIVPVITLGTVPSGLPNVKTTFRVIGRELTDHEKADMRKIGIPDQSIIESVFTSAFREQTHTYTRESLGLPSDRFLLLVVGGRLDQEVTAEFIHMFLRTMEANTHMVFLGHFPLYNNFCENYPDFANRSSYLGFMEDVLAVNEVCDLYVNPTRLGGGTSAAEALYKGLPVVTVSYGDVAVGAGPDFCVESYEKMSEAIIRYASDSGFYSTMSRKAESRASLLTDTSKYFPGIIEKAVQSPLFR